MTSMSLTCENKRNSNLPVKFLVKTALLWKYLSLFLLLSFVLKDKTIDALSTTAAVHRT